MSCLRLIRAKAAETWKGWMVRMEQRQLGIAMRTAIILSACLTLAAMTSGVLLVIHLGDVEHPASHDSHNCSVCQQLLVVPKGLAPSPSTELVRDAHLPCENPPELIACVQDTCLGSSQPRGPPSSHLAQSV